MSRKSRSNVSRLDDHIYYDVIIEHDDANNPLNLATPAVFQETRNEAIIENPEDYHLSIVRFEIPGQEIPLFIFSPADENTKATLNISDATVTLSYQGTDVQKPLIYVPLNNVPIPNPPYTLTNETSNTYFAVKSYQQLLDWINTAFQTAFNDLKLAFPSAPPTKAPYMVFNQNDGTVSLFAQKLYDEYVTGGPSTTIEIWMNRSLWGFFRPALEVFENLTVASQTNGKQDRLIVKNTGKNQVVLTPPSGNSSSLFWSALTTYPIGYVVAYTSFGTSYYISKIAGNIGNTPSTSPIQWALAISPDYWLAATVYTIGDIVLYLGDYYVNLIAGANSSTPNTVPTRWAAVQPLEGLEMRQEFNTLFNWQAFQSIVFTSGTIPIKEEYIKGPDNFRKILTDFKVDASKGTEARSLILYNPTAEYRLMDMVGNVPLRFFDIQVYWLDIFDNLHQLMIPNHFSVSMKLLFRKKSIIR